MGNYIQPEDTMRVAFSMSQYYSGQRLVKGSRQGSTVSHDGLRHS